MQRILRSLALFIDDILLLAGCGCILYGLSLWSAIATWLMAGAMLIGYGLLVGKEMAKHAAKQPVQ